MTAGGELLRAVLDKSCQNSNPVIYAASVLNVGVSLPDNGIGVQVRIDKDTVFLLTSMSTVLCEGPNAWVGANIACQMYDPQTGKFFSNIPVPPTAGFSSTFNNPFTFPVYPFVEGGQYLNVWAKPLEPNTFCDRIIVHFHGIEYRK